MKILKRIGVGISILLVLVFVSAFVLSMVGSSKYGTTYEISAPLLTEVSADSASIANGAHLANIHACTDCHGADLSGQVMIDAPPFLVSATNLTSGKGGIGATNSTADLDRAIRYGVDRDGHALLAMPSKTLHYLSDADTEDLIAYMQSLPAVDNELPAKELRFPGRMIAGIGGIDFTEGIHETADRPAAPAAGPTADYGAYLTSITCGYCHSSDLRGGPPIDPAAPASPDLLAAGQWTFEMFETLMRTGERPDGRVVEPIYMPWEAFKHMTTDELQAIYAYLNTLAG